MLFIGDFWLRYWY